MAPAMNFDDFVHTGPGTLAGRYLRMFWQPVCCSHELSVAQALPIRIMDEEFTLYRGESGAAHLVGYRCAHRGAQLSAGWVEGDFIRCFYHGWKYDGAGRCVEQPAEAEPFAPKVRVPAYPVQEYLGLIFAYFGEGEPPPLPRYPKMESADISLDVAGLRRICNYFNNVENSLDSAHVRFVHRRHRDPVQDHIVLGDPTITVEESEWGVERHAKYPDGKEVTKTAREGLAIQHSTHEQRSPCLLAIVAFLRSIHLTGQDRFSPHQHEPTGIDQSFQLLKRTASLRSKRFKAAALQEVVVTLLKVSGRRLSYPKNRPLPRI